RRTALAELIEQIRSQLLRIQELLEPHRGQLADLIFGVVGAALLENALADLLHDLLDVDRFGTNSEIAHREYPFALFRAANSGASLMVVPRMPSDCLNACMPARLIATGTSPTCGK